jgi:tRNA threonylcarbamoyl adenosine modification protein (Sua5/YciO/YrdC/YwlC family)
MNLTLYPNSINNKHIQQAAAVLEKGGLLIYPTDTVYALGCLSTHQAALKKLAQLKGVKLEKAKFSFLFENISGMSQYVKPLDTATFRLLNHLLPGPYTFILPAQQRIPKPFDKRKTLGVRIADHPVLHELLPLLSAPLITTSLHDEDQIKDYTTDPDEIYATWQDQIDLMLSCGFGGNTPSTVVDLTAGEPQLLRMGKGEFPV